MASTITRQAAARIKQGRKQLGLTQQVLADRLDAIGEPLSRGTLAKIEAGARDVTIEELMAIAIALNVPPAWLLLPQPDTGTVRVAGLTLDAGQTLLWLLGEEQLEDSPYARPLLNEAQLAFRLYREYFDGQRRLINALGEIQQMRDVENSHGPGSVGDQWRSSVRERLQSAAASLAASADILRAAGIPVPSMDPTHEAMLKEMGIDPNQSSLPPSGLPPGEREVQLWDADREARYDPEWWASNYPQEYGR